MRGPVRALAEPRRGVRLRVEIDHERALAGLGEAGREIHGGGRLSDAALLVCERVDPSGHALEATQARGRFRATPGRRGNRSGVGPSFSTTSRRRRSEPGTATTCASRAGDLRGRRFHLLLVRVARVEDEAAAGRDERQAPLDRDRRRRERAGERGRVGVAAGTRRVLLGPGADDLHVRERGSLLLEERALAGGRFEQRHPEVGERRGERDPRGASPEPTSITGPASTRSERGERIVQMDAAQFRRVGEAREAGCREERGEPALHPLVAHQAGATTMQRFGSAPSLSVVTPPRPCR